MKTIVLNVLIFLLITITLSCSDLKPGGSAPALATPTIAFKTLSCDFPTDVPAADAGQQAFDQYSWDMFVALNWPAKTDQRGQPDCSEAIGSATPVVWQTYKTVNQIFLPNAKNPGPWNSALQIPSLTSINIAALKNTGVVSAVDQAVGGWLIDQQGNPTYYQILANETVYDYIVSNDFYNADVVSRANNINFPSYSTEVKASWRILEQGKDDFSRYLTMQAQVAEYNMQGQPTGNMSAAMLGLVGLHIITKAQGYPQWIWSTFEQVDNVPPKVNVDGYWKDNPQPNINYSYYDALADPTSVNQSPCDWERKDNQLICVPKTGESFKTPDPLNRVTPIAPETKAVNTTLQQSLKQTVFQYYQLITTQRPLMPDNPSNPLGQPTPALSANITMESYIQSNSSCMNCHSIATPVHSNDYSDFSYLFKFAKSPVGSSN